jgi:hypothetical protein
MKHVARTVWTDMSIAARLAHIPQRAAFWALAGVALLVSHDAILLAQVGPGEPLTRALREGGHDYWGIASLALATVGLAALATGLIRLRGLRRRAHALGAQPTIGPRPYVARWLGSWARMLPLVAAGFVVQENIEHLIGHSHAPGLGALIGPEYPLALPVIALITGLAAVVVAALSQTERALLAVIADALRRFIRRPPRHTLRPPLRLAASLGSPLARAWAGRAPPRLLVSAT